MNKLRFLWYVVRLAKEPTRTDQVFRLSDMLRSGIRGDTRKKYCEQLLGNDEFRRLYESGDKRYLARPYDLDGLIKLPPGTLGHQYARNMREQGLDPEFFEAFEAYDALSYYSQRMRKTHDIWHTVTGFATHIPGEIGLQAFYFGNVWTPLPLAIMASTFLHLLGTRNIPMARSVFEHLVVGYESGKAARSLAGVDWESLFATDLEEVRSRLGVRPNRQVWPMALPQSA